MIYLLALIAVVIAICVLLNNASSKIGMPVLLAFILLGMAFGNNGLFPIKFENYSFAETICTSALIFIMFYGGFGTRWDSAKSVIRESGLLASLGVILTAGITGTACHFLLKWGWLESFLIGSVLGSTDAASVFSILRSRKLGLRNNSAPILEIESGSNDPFSYMLTILILSLMKGDIAGGQIAWMLVKQLGFGIGIGMVLAQAAVYAMKHLRFATSGFDSLMVFAFAIGSYAIPSLLGGNGFLSAYIVGLVLGNSSFNGKKNMVNFFDGFTGLMQVLIFFMLGLLIKPSMMHEVLLPALAIFLILLILARPVSVALVLSPFRKYKFKQQCLISFVGLRGASSIVFAIIATVGNAYIENDLLNVVFCVVLLSISIQGFLLPAVARGLDMIDENADVMKTFNDFADETDMQFSEILIKEGNPWNGKLVRDLGLPKSMLLCNLVKKDGESLVPNGNTMINAGDQVILCTKAFKSDKSLQIIEHHLDKNSEWYGKRVREYPIRKSQLILIKRANGEDVIPNGDTVFKEGDTLFINKTK